MPDAAGTLPDCLGVPNFSLNGDSLRPIGTTSKVTGVPRFEGLVDCVMVADSTGGVGSRAWSMIAKIQSLRPR